MRFDKFDLKAYGPYTDKVLDLPKNEEGDLHIVYGPNEAGKSSLLRAIRDMLFGIPAKTPDNFIHEYRKLRVGGQLSTTEETLEFLRKKGNANTLLSKDESVLPDAKMAAFLGAIDASYFTQMFGLDTEKLRSGAESLLSGEGSTGEILFSASNGGFSVKNALEALQNESDQLFKARKSKGVKIYETLDKIKDLKKQLKEDKLKPEGYQRATRVAQNLQKEVSSTKARIKELEQSLRVLEAQKQSIPIYLRYEETTQRLHSYDLPALAPNFAQTLRQQLLDVIQAETSLTDAQAVAESTLARLQSLSEPVFLDSEILQINTLIRQEEMYSHNAAEYLKLKNHLERVEERLGATLEELGISSIDDIPASPSKVEYQELKAVLRGLYDLNVREQSTIKEIESLERIIQGLQEDLRAIGEPQQVARLAELFSRVEAHYLQLSSYRAQELAGEELDRECERLCDGIGIARDCVIEEYNLPSEDLTARYHQELQELTKQQSALESQLYELELLRVEKLSKLDSLNLHGSIYTQKDLEEARLRRTKLLDKALTEEKHLKNLADLQGAVTQADQIVDQLRANSDRILEASRLQNELNALAQKKALTEERLEKIGAELRRNQVEWQALFELLPMSPVEVEELSQVRIQWRSLLEKRRARREKSQALVLLQETTQKLLHECVAEDLPCDVTDFEQTYRWIKADQMTKSEKHGRREELLRQLYEKQDLLKRELDTIAEVEALRKRLEQDWYAFTESYQLPHRVMEVEAVQSIFDQRQEAFQAHQELLETTQEAETLRDFVQDYESTRASLLGSYHKILQEAGLAEQSVEVQWQYVIQKKDQELESQQRLQDLKERYREQQLECEEKLRIYDVKQALLNKSLKSAHLEKAEEIEEFLRCLSEQTTLMETHQNLEATLLALFPNKVKVENISDEIKGVDSFEVEQTIEKQREEIESLEKVYYEMRDQMNAAFKLQRSFEISSQKAADTQQALSDAMSDLKTFSTRYMTLQSAIKFLHEQVEEYRKENQGPMIHYTSEYFQQLTCQQYKGVVNQPDDQNIPRLYAIDSLGDELIEVSHLSEGTADQLYLALRLAALKLHFQSRAPMPLILDDVLMTFDESRTRAVLKVLKEFSHKTQVFVFTHHQHISDLATTEQANVIMLKSEG